MHESFYMKKFIKKNYQTSIIFFFFVYSINMPNTQQNNIQNEIQQIKKEIDLLQDRLKKTKKL